jgi:hypothetical protein
MGLDYKLIIIFGLAVVIYFIYKEVDVLFDKLSSLEERIKLFEMKDTLLLSEQVNLKEHNIMNMTELLGTKNIILDLNTTLNNADIMYPNLTDSNSKYLEIYSNDNSSYNTSIKDSVISDVVFDYDGNNINIIPDVENKDSIKESIKEDVKEDVKEEEIKISNYESELKNMKVGEIIKIAQEYNIELNKKINGVSKKKIKQELINEIIQKKNI